MKKKSHRIWWAPIDVTKSCSFKPYQYQLICLVFFSRTSLMDLFFSFLFMVTGGGGLGTSFQVTLFFLLWHWIDRFKLFATQKAPWPCFLLSPAILNPYFASEIMIIMFLIQSESMTISVWLLNHSRFYMTDVQMINSQFILLT